MTTADEVREQQRQAWDRFAPGWGKWDHLVVPMLEPISMAMLDLIGPVTGDHLDVASGTGEPGLDLAASARTVTLTDLSRRMLDEAEAKASARAVDNIVVTECSADDLPFDDDSFDSATCRLGFMFFPDLAAAAAELRRVMKPGARLVAAVWAGPEGNPWGTLPNAAIASEIVLPAPPPDAPGLFRCAEPAIMTELLTSAGFTEAAEHDVRATGTVPSAEEFWQYMTEVAGPVIAALDQLDHAARSRVDRRIVADLGRFDTGDGLEFPLHARCITATAS